MTFSESGRRALVVGLGIAGLSAAVRLRTIGWDVVVVEKAAERRRSGYFIGLFGSGKAAAEHLGVAQYLPDRKVVDSRNYDVDRTGRRRPGLGYGDLPGDPQLVTRDEIENALYQGLPDGVEIRYSTSPIGIHQNLDSSGRARSVDVQLQDLVTAKSTTERFDLVIGADGLRSSVRQMAFDQPEGTIHRLGFMIGACAVPDGVPGLRRQDGMILSEKGRSVWVFAFPDRAPTALFSYRTDDVDGEFQRAPIDSLRRAFAPVEPGGTVEALLAAFENDPAPLFDTTEQVRLDSWHNGRVVLLGDAAWCLTLYSGMGATTGMAGAVLLGTMLDRHSDDIDQALDDWEAQLKPFIVHHRQNGIDMRRIFTSATVGELLSRKAFSRLLRIPALRRQLLGNPNTKDAKMKTHDITVTALT